MDRAEHLAWCKKRAIEYINAGDIEGGVTSMLSDMDKHPETKLQAGGVLAQLGMLTIIQNNIPNARRFVEGFN